MVKYFVLLIYYNSAFALLTAELLRQGKCSESIRKQSVLKTPVNICGFGCDRPQRKHPTRFAVPNTAQRAKVHSF